ncbi:ParB N-terminal domain-containing protein [Streptomyces caniscabiei]|uniref:ParB N-terminal domain-containing protein n=1 Tax=Streptomyces caniscabiei TaxID=2746961 RepID=A0ABU4MTL0_9ACTN|nr:ParB N-terminal domain-containing protein [Streptomyces caniscabiei]MBE4735741.1 ParB N-terminal domain-containing protein [Streptomyces caniscabiei]MBE4758354.1 ParB N-terminal domain-containing protein [Streptomyces caniscabiei]MBE4788445.1 ParB N-terminal domain-containing protein [Streptomyces caniscabiei]MDX2986541.1 ParB N-terminal domain-containing protein [Streptomyces caniscabiei]MDX3039418.1 ParB N-terminal domain-containing protein [Streptomyces caniscabiei]
MTDTTTPSVCPNCQHPHHLPGTECSTPVHHGPSHWHLCLCLARPGAALSCPPQMACQGGTLGYSDIWYLQQGHSLSSADGVISPEVLTVGPVSVGYPAASAVVPAADRAAPELTAEEARDLAEDLGYQLYRAQDALAFVGECCDIADREQRPVTTADVREWLRGARCGRQLLADVADRAALRDRIRRAVCEAEGFAWDSDMLEPDEYGDVADMVLSVLPAPADRAAVLSDAERTMLGWALDQAQLRMWKTGKHTAEEQAALVSLRRMAVESAAVDRVAADWFAAARFVEAMNEACDQKPCEACTTREDVASELRRVAAETPPAETQAELQVWPLRRILTEVRCGSKDWSWEEEWADLARRHAETGYLDRLADQISENGITMPVLVGTDGRLWDGHHRLCIAVRLGIGYVPVEVVRPAVEAQPGKDTETREADRG